MPRPDRRAGFTLIEVLAALAITGALVSVALPYAARLVTRWWVGERTVEVADGWMQALARLDDDISQAMPLAVPVEGKAAPAFRAGSTFIVFVRAALGQKSITDLETVRFEIRTSARGVALVRRSSRFAAATFFAEPAAIGTPTTLVEGAFQLRFSVLDKDGTAHAEWGGQVDMPTAVALYVTSVSRDALPPSPILLRVMARASGRGSQPNQ